MGYGHWRVVPACLMSVTGDQLVVPTSFSYVAALIYLAVFASVIGFTAYLMLVARIGSAQAGYATVVFPVVALLLSTVAEASSGRCQRSLALGSS